MHRIEGHGEILSAVIAPKEMAGISKLAQDQNRCRITEALFWLKSFKLLVAALFRLIKHGLFRTYFSVYFSGNSSSYSELSKARNPSKSKYSAFIYRVIP